MNLTLLQRTGMKRQKEVFFRIYERVSVSVLVAKFNTKASASFPCCVVQVITVSIGYLVATVMFVC